MTSPIYADYVVEAQFNGVDWVDISSDIISNIYFKYGIFGGGPLDRVGEPGEMKFTLNNTENNSGGIQGYYTPGGTYCRAGFTTGLPVKIMFTYDGEDKYKFYGTIPTDGIKVQTGRYSQRAVSVTVKDWMHQALIHEMISPALAENKTMPEAAALVVANVVKQPLATNYRTGAENLNTVFDVLRTTTRALSEFRKLANTELGFIYITRKTGKEVLRVEGRYTRNDEVSTASSIPTFPDYLATEDDNYLMTEDDNYLMLGAVEVPTFDNSMYDMSAPFGEMLYNRIKVTAYPRIIDAAATTILYSLTSPIAVGATPVTFTARFSDPNRLYDNVAGMDMVTPVATTHYKLYQNSNGTGTNLTANFTVTAVYGAIDVNYTITKSSGIDGYLTFLQAVGKGIYIPDPVDYIAEDAASILKSGPSQLNFDMKYQDDPTASVGVADIILSQHKDGKLMPEKVSFYANRTSSLMNAFLYIEPGDRVSISEEVSDSASDYFIQGVEATIGLAGNISFSWYLRDAGYDTFEYCRWDGVSATDGWDIGKWAF